MKYPIRAQTAELGQVFRWSVQLGQFVRWSAQIYPLVSDEVHTETQTWNEEMSSYFQMKCSDKLSDITPQVSDEVLRWSAHWDPNLKWVHIFRWSVQLQIYPPWNCQWQQINYCLIYVFNESPFKTVTELGQLFRWSVQLGQLVRWSAQIYPHVKLSVTGAAVITDLCLQWEPIWNGCGIRSSFQMKCPSRSTCQMKCTMTSDIAPNWAWISARPLHCLIFMTDWPHPSSNWPQIHDRLLHQWTPSQSNVYPWKTITLHNFHDRLTPPLLQLTTDPWQTTTPYQFHDRLTPPLIDHKCMVDHYMT